MNARNIRRAIERKAQKQARKEAARSLSAVPGSSDRNAVAAESPAVDARSVSELQWEANRRNAARSTGPTSAEGKARSSRNALKTGLTGRTVLLADEDAALYEHHVQPFFKELKPVGDRETALVQSIADAKWRLGRIPSLEFGIFALGRIQFAEEFQHLPNAEAAALIEAKTYLAYGRQLNNLSIQECRLRRQCDKDAAELTRLQQLRAEAERVARRAAPPAVSPNPQTQSNGFEFSIADFASADSDLDTDLLRLPQAA